MLAKNWKWYGTAGHFICGFDCRFHLTTVIGAYMVSTVGEYFPDSPVREIEAEAKGIVLKGRGDERKYDFLNRIGFIEIGCDRKFETMVFRIGELCTCGCSMPTISGSELDFEGYNDAKSATEGHMSLCEKWAKKRQPKVTKQH